MTLFGFLMSAYQKNLLREFVLSPVLMEQYAWEMSVRMHAPNQLKRFNTANELLSALPAPFTRFELRLPPNLLIDELVTIRTFVLAELGFST